MSGDGQESLVNSVGLLRILDWENPSDRTLPNSAPPGWNRQWCCQKSAQIVTSPTRSGQYAARFQLNRDDPVVSSSKRTELSEPTPGPATPERVERWIGFSIFLPNDWVKDPSAESVTQWHQFADIGGGPPLALITNNGQWQISQHWENFEKHTLIGAYETGRWTDWIFHIRWSPESDGFITIWRDGGEVFSAQGKNKHNDGHAVYMKFGIYKWDWQSNPSKSQVNERVMFYDSLRIADEGGSYPMVDPGSSPPPLVVLRPKSDVEPWTVNGAPTAWAALDDEVTQPTPVDATDYIWSGGSGRVTEVSMGTTSSGQGSTAQAWFYANTGFDTRLGVEVVSGGSTVATIVVEPGQPFQWRSIDFSIGNSASTDDLRLRFTILIGADSNVRAAYITVPT
jgi:Polysaccharide lyase